MNKIKVTSDVSKSPGIVAMLVARQRYDPVKEEEGYRNLYDRVFNGMIDGSIVVEDNKLKVLK